MNFEEQLASGLEGVVVVMGIGNPWRGDDAAGSLVARQIVCPPGSHVIDAEEVPENYLQQVISQHPATIVFIDSVDLGAAPGSVALLDADQLARYWPSTHRMPIGLLMSILARETHARIVGIGIQPAHTEFSRPLSEPVRASVEHVAAVLNHVLARDSLAVSSTLAVPSKGEVQA
jgi:hydrogenase maturation protease